MTYSKLKNFNFDIFKKLNNVTSFALRRFERIKKYVGI